LLIQDHGALSREADDVLMAGLESSPWQHLDDPCPTPRHGETHVCYTLSNPLRGLPDAAVEERLTVLAVLQGGRALPHRLDEMRGSHLQKRGCRREIQRRCAGRSPRRSAPEVEWGRGAFAALQRGSWDAKPVGAARQPLREAGAWAAYWARESDDHTLVLRRRPQFPGLTGRLSLVWVHLTGGRH